jgi:hypothetical protein
MHFPYLSTIAMGHIWFGKSKIPQFHKLKTCMHNKVPRIVMHFQIIPLVYLHSTDILLIIDIFLFWNLYKNTSYNLVRKNYMSNI